MIYLPPFAKEGDDDGGGIKWRENQFAHRRAAPVHQRGTSLNLGFYSASLCRCARVSFVEFQAASPTAKQDPHFQQVL